MKKAKNNTKQNFFISMSLPTNPKKSADYCLRSVGLLLTTAVQVLDYLSISNKQ